MTMVIIGRLTASPSLLPDTQWKTVIEAIIRRDLEHAAKRANEPLPKAAADLPSCTFSPELATGSEPDSVIQGFVAMCLYFDRETRAELCKGLALAVEPMLSAKQAGWDQVISSLVRFIRLMGPTIADNYRKGILEFLLQRHDLPKELKEAMQADVKSVKL